MVHLSTLTVSENITQNGGRKAILNSLANQRYVPNIVTTACNVCVKEWREDDRICQDI